MIRWLPAFTRRMSSKFTHVVACISTLIFLTNNSPLYEYITFIHSTVGEHLRYFHFGAIVDNAAMNIHVPVVIRPYVLIPLGNIPRKGTARSYNCMFNLLKTAGLSSKEAAPFYIPINNVWGLQLLHILTNTYCQQSFYYSHPGRCDVVVLCGLNLLFLHD